LETATSDELALVSLLAEYNAEDERNASSILSRTLAVHQKRGLLPPNAVDYIRERIAQVKATFLEQPNVPQWINHAAMKAGVDFFRAWHIWQAYQIRGVVSIDNAADFSVDDWFRTLIEVMTILPPYDIQLYLAREELRTENILTRLRDAVQGQEYVNSLPWEMPNDWPGLWETLGSIVHSYMNGDDYAQVAWRLLELSPEESIDNSRSSGAKPIPKVFAFLRKVVHHLAIDAGCFAAVHEFGINEAAQPLPDGLQALPLCIRNGCDSIGVLAWYRFGYRQRMCAHAFQQAFPVPDALEDDQSRLDWITKTRRRWLSGEMEARDHPLLDHAKTVIQESI
jgi:hypothetical protein